MLSKLTIAVAAAALVGSVTAGAAANYSLSDPELAQFNRSYADSFAAARGTHTRAVYPAGHDAFAYSVSPNRATARGATVNEQSEPWQNNW